MSKLPVFSISQLLEAGVHYGHKTMRWNPKMAPYLFGSRNGTHIIDLQQTAPMLHNALKVIYDVVRKNGKILFVGTKRQASEPIAQAAIKCGQYYVNHRWLGGMLTNWNTVSASINTLRNTEAHLENNTEGLKKKEVLQLTRKAEKLRMSLGGIMELGGHPDLIIIIDVNKENLALKEANNLNIPVIAVVDSNCSPDGVDHVIPGNDDATRSIQLYCDLIVEAALAGIQDSLGAAGIDVGSLDEVPMEDIKNLAKNDNKEKSAPSKKTASKNSDAKKSNDKPAKAEKEKTATTDSKKKDEDKKESKTSKSAKKKADDKTKETETQNKKED